MFPITCGDGSSDDFVVSGWFGNQSRGRARASRGEVSAARAKGQKAGPDCGATGFSLLRGGREGRGRGLGVDAGATVAHLAAREAAHGDDHVDDRGRRAACDVGSAIEAVTSRRPRFFQSPSNRMPGVVSSRAVTRHNLSRQQPLRSSAVHHGRAGWRLGAPERWDVGQTEPTGAPEAPDAPRARRREASFPRRGSNRRRCDW